MPTVRTKVACHMDRCVTSSPNVGAMLINNWTLLEKVFRVAAGFLDEGTLRFLLYVIIVILIDGFHTFHTWL